MFAIESRWLRINHVTCCIRINVYLRKISIVTHTHTHVFAWAKRCQVGENRKIVEMPALFCRRQTRLRMWILVLPFTWQFFNVGAIWAMMKMFPIKRTRHPPTYSLLPTPLSPQPHPTVRHNSNNKNKNNKQATRVHVVTLESLLARTNLKGVFNCVNLTPFTAPTHLVPPPPTWADGQTEATAAARWAY